MKAKVIHFSGGYAHGRRMVLSGWAICKTGDAAWAVRREGNHTKDGAAVTCRACLTMMDRQLEDFEKKLAAVLDREG